jgi:hypothetical protein
VAAQAITRSQQLAYEFASYSGPVLRYGPRFLCRQKAFPPAKTSPGCKITPVAAGRPSKAGWVHRFFLYFLCPTRSPAAKLTKKSPNADNLDGISLTKHPQSCISNYGRVCKQEWARMLGCWYFFVGKEVLNGRKTCEEEAPRP